MITGNDILLYGFILIALYIFRGLVGMLFIVLFIALLSALIFTCGLLFAFFMWLWDIITFSDYRTKRRLEKLSSIYNPSSTHTQKTFKDRFQNLLTFIVNLWNKYLGKYIHKKVKKNDNI